jgi:RNA polymerase sigma factor (sigma-70 family)
VKVDDWIRSGLPALAGFARALVGDRGVAEDIVQDVLTRLVAEPERFEDIENLDAYLRRMIVNTYISWGRKWFRVHPFALVPHHPGPRSDPFDTVLDRDELRLGLAKLPRRQRAVLVLRFYEDLSDQDIAQLLGCSLSTVRPTADTATRRLDSQASRAVRSSAVVDTGVLGARLTGHDLAFSTGRCSQTVPRSSRL